MKKSDNYVIDDEHLTVDEIQDIIDPPEDLIFQPRWRAIATYNVFWQGGIKEEETIFFFEEIHELHNLIENSENFHAIKNILIAHNNA